ncbi:hypothetical protein TRIATDRAFT_297487 [Trichoderma atroviride IMI 206040]|uniref:Uncharacterized protein n=1 Tax=Hypocrea atroviridis (strain ATCC 20476 / IMI 206040) TaxID=452589 RepID=G9NI73_HYPAI|nr:uncharacterized protein TRIATDRAFT_297487 [Trichoderma atroviride IMI 206040]EHK49485.1 hypothetical protein TRIATDRAFT_297487 [Trichoderma atroviride IMI 206040]
MHQEAARDSFTPTTPKISPYFLHHLGYNGIFFPLEGGSFYSFCGIDRDEFSPTPRHPLTTYSNDKYLISHIPLASYMIHSTTTSHLLISIFFSLLCYARKNGNFCLCLSLYFFHFVVWKG